MRWLIKVCGVIYPMHPFNGARGGNFYQSVTPIKKYIKHSKREVNTYEMFS